MQTYNERFGNQQCYADFSKGQWADWFVAPCALNRDSDELQQSNWEVQLDMLNQTGTEGEDFTIIRTSHWACGWIDWLLVQPDSPCVTVCEDIEAKLDDYPVLDSEHFAEKEWEAYSKWWQNSRTKRELLTLLVRKKKITEEQAEALEEADLQQWYQDCVPSGDYFGEQCYPRLQMVADSVGAEEIEKLLSLA